MLDKFFLVAVGFYEKQRSCDDKPDAPKKPIDPKAYTMMVLVGFLVFILSLIVNGLIIMLLWNWVMPHISRSVGKINLWQAIGLKFLIDILLI